jgi:RNA polymerase-interacting CarD/CdnL/TRCF family regulator
MNSFQDEQDILAIEFESLDLGCELDRYRDLLRSPALALSKNYHQRHLELDKRLKEGAFQALCEVVRDLTVSNSRKTLGSKDAATLRKARESLCEEWAAAAELSITEAVKEVGTLLEAAQPYPEVI